MAMALAAAMSSGMATAAHAEESEHHARAAEHFAELDADGNGIFSRDEAEEQAAQRFSEADTDGNGSLSEEEAIAMHEARREERHEARQARREERREERREGSHHAERFTQHAGEDGIIDMSEFSEHALQRFEGADLDENGSVTATEMRLAMRAMHGRRGEHRGGPRGHHDDD